MLKLTGSINANRHTGWFSASVGFKNLLFYPSPSEKDLGISRFHYGVAINCQFDESAIIKETMTYILVNFNYVKLWNLELTYIVDPLYERFKNRYKKYTDIFNFNNTTYVVHSIKKYEYINIDFDFRTLLYLPIYKITDNEIIKISDKINLDELPNSDQNYYIIINSSFDIIDNSVTLHITRYTSRPKIIILEFNKSDIVEYINNIITTELLKDG